MNAATRPARWKPLLRELIRRFTAAGIQIKTTGIAVAMVLLLGAGVTLQVRAYLAHELGQGLEERGVAVARGLAGRATDLALTGNRFGLYELIRETIETNPDVRYAFVADRDGQVLTHSFTNAVPPDLLSVNQVRAETPYQIALLHSDEGIIHDIAVPLLGGRAGVIRVGLTEHRLQASIARAVRALLATTAAALLVGVVAAFLLTRVVTRPVLELVEVTRAVGAGQLDRKARRHMDDEIGELADAFNAMTDALARSRDELLRHNRELAALNEELRQKEAQRSQLLQRLIGAQEDERKRIARELHDEAGSALTSLLVGLRLLETEACVADGLSERIAELRETCAHTLEGLRRLSAELRPSALDRLGLVPALEQMAADHGRRWGTAVHFQAVGLDEIVLPAEVASSLYRIVQEALTNVARHAQARTVGVLLERRPDAVVLIVEDDGRGFDPHAPAGDEGVHLGLLGIRERAALLGGRLTIESAPGQGTTLFVEIPCAAATLAAACAGSPSDDPFEEATR